MTIQTIKLQLLFLFFFISVTISVIAQTRYLVPYRDGKLWGYADTNTNIIVKPKYDEAAMFLSGYAWVAKGKLQGVLNAKGEEIIPPEYDALNDCCFGNVIAVKGNRVGLIRLKSGKIILPLTYLGIRSLAYNRFYITTRQNQLKGLFDAITYKWVLKEWYNEISFDYYGTDSFYYTAIKEKDTTYFSLTENGKFFIIKPPKKQLAFTEEKTETVAVVQELLEDVSGQGNYIQTSFYTQNGKTGYLYIQFQNGVKTIDSIPAIYDVINRMVGDNQLLIVRKDGKEGVITIKNNEVIPLLYDEVKAVDSTIIHGIYIVKMNDRFGLVQAGRLLLPCDYDAIMSSHSEIEGFILQQNNKKGAYIYDKTKKLYHVIIPTKYDIIWHLSYLQPANFSHSIPYYNGYENVKFIVFITKDGKRGFIDLFGREFFTNK